MAIFYLIRHGNNDYVGNTIVGWTPGIQLNAEGAHQAERLALRLGDAGIRRIFSSPLDRALGTAAPLAATLGLRVEVRDELGEVRFGDWTGRRLADLEIEPHWQRFQSYRSGTRAPGGELMVESQARIVAELERLRIAYPRDTIAVVSHADIIRAA